MDKPVEHTWKEIMMSNLLTETIDVFAIFRTFHFPSLKLKSHLFSIECY